MERGFAEKETESRRHDQTRWEQVEAWARPPATSMCANFDRRSANDEHADQTSASKTQHQRICALHQPAPFASSAPPFARRHVLISRVDAVSQTGPACYWLLALHAVREGLEIERMLDKWSDLSGDGIAADSRCGSSIPILESGNSTEYIQKSHHRHSPKAKSDM